MNPGRIDHSRFQEIISRREREVASLQILETRLGEQPKDRESAIRSFHAMFEHCPMAAWLKTADGYVIARNAAYGELFGKTQEQQIGRRDVAAWARDEAENYAITDTIALNQGYATRHEPVLNELSDRREALDVIKWVWELDDGERITVGVVAGHRPLPESAKLHER